VVNIDVPKFGVGEVDAVLAYAREAVPRLCQRIGCRNSAEVEAAFMEALVANATRMQDSLLAPFVPWIEPSRKLLTMMERELILGVDFSGLQHVDEALDFMATGGNVLLVSNHTSGADTLVLDWVVNLHAHNAAYNWTYMAGHVVNLYLLPLVVTGGVNRLQIFSERYAQLVDANMRSQMRAQNTTALRALRNIAGRGGQCVVLYPEGGRGEGALKPGEAQTMQIALLMARASEAGLMVLPSYVESAGILPVRRVDNEFNEFIEHARPGDATLAFGPAQPWEELLPSTAMSPAELRTHLVKEVMLMIADLAPSLAARGPHVR
jgi:1-acyl-sn-glycerol-3-phosphate acyltransferase